MKKFEKTDFASLWKRIDALENTQKALATSLISKAEFMEETLIELQEKVKKDGAVTEMCQGSYSIERESPALRSYNTTVKNYTAVVKQLLDVLPPEETKTDGFESFGDDAE